jgi:hypothetical protein
MGKIKVVFFTGIWRSGATILARIMETSKQAFFIGEIREFWVKGNDKKSICSCGEKFENCNFWNKVTEEYLKSFPENNTDEISKKIIEFEKRSNYYKLRKYLKNKDDKEFKKSLDYYLNHYEKMYEAIAKVTGRKILLDTSRLPRILLALSFSKKIDLYPIFMIRDPRGLINSLIQKDIRHEVRDRRSSLKQILVWNAKNFFNLDLMKKLKNLNSLYICYENFAKNPRNVIEKINNMLKMNLKLDENDGQFSANLEPSHMFAANRSRFQSGKTEIFEDDRWKKQLNWSSKFLIFTLSYPLYKYVVKKYIQ